MVPFALDSWDALEKGPRIFVVELVRFMSNNPTESGVCKMPLGLGVVVLSVDGLNTLDIKDDDQWLALCSRIGPYS